MQYATAESKIVRGGKRGVDWQKSLSTRGNVLAEVLSAAIKEIRRSNEEEALYWALEMMAAGSEAENFLWECLVVFAAEDIGLINPETLGVVMNARTAYFMLPAGDKRRRLFIAFVTTYLSRSSKSRYVTELLLDMVHRVEKEEYTLQIPDYAIDLHTDRGKAMGRGLYHYLTSASVSLDPQRDHFSDEYLQHLVTRAEQEDRNKKTAQ